MSKLLRVAEFAAGTWVAAATSLGAFLAYAGNAHSALTPMGALLAYGSFGLVIGMGCWHIRRAVRGR